MSDKRRAEILAKRAKLEEMRKAKAQRQAEAERRTSLVRSRIPRLLRAGSLISIFKGRTPPPKLDERDLEGYITKIIGPSRGVDTGELSPSIPGTPSLSSVPIPSGRGSRQSNEGSDRQDSSFGRYTNSGTDHAVDRCVLLFTLALSLSNRCYSSTIIPRLTVDLIDIEQELFELPQKVRL